MKSFLTKQEKNELLVVSAFLGYITDLQTKLQSSNLSKAIESTSRFIDKYFKGLNEFYVVNLRKELGQMEIVCKDKKQAAEEKRKIQESNQYAHILYDDFHDLASAVVDTKCKSCKIKTLKNAEACRIRKILLTCDVPILDDNPPICPYK